MSTDYLPTGRHCWPERVCACMQKLTPNDSVCWEIPADVPFGTLPTYIKIHLFRYEGPAAHAFCMA